MVLSLSACGSSPPPAELTSPNAPQADFYMGDVKRVIYDKTGHATSRIAAQTVSADRKNESSVWENLNYSFERQGRRWQLSAGQGRMEKNQIIRFSNDIEIRRLNLDGNTDFTLTTGELSLDLEINKLWSDATIKIAFAKGQFEGDGLVAYLDRNSLSLNHVSGHFYHD